MQTAMEVYLSGRIQGSLILKLSIIYGILAGAWKMKS